MKLYVLKWREGDTKHEAVTPLLPHPGHAYVWLFDQKPYLIRRFAEISCTIYRTPLWKR